jgi:hypothetical protein
MRRLLSIFFAVFLSLPAFCQGKHQFYKAVESLNEKTWKEYKICKNDSCWSVDNQEYYYFAKWRSGLLSGGDSAYIQYEHLEVKNKDNSSEKEVAWVSCSPVILFHESPDNTDSVFRVCLIPYENDATLFLLSNDQFVISRNKEGYGDDRAYIAKYYYKLVTPPEIVVNNINKFYR